MKADESYKNLAESFQNVFPEINSMVNNPIITIEGETYGIIFFFFLLLWL